MERKRDITEVLFEIKNGIPGFNKEELLEYIEWAIPKLYNSLANEIEPEVKCTPELINKLRNQSSKYRITKDIDSISVQYSELFDNIKKDDETLIILYLSIYFYDKTENNVGNINNKNDRYWNDIWIVTCKKNNTLNKNNSNCINCGAVMEYDKAKDVFECKYCGNIINNRNDSNWEIVDIELGN